MSSGPLYEKSVLVAAGIDEDFVAWLDSHVADARTIPGVVSVDVAETVAPQNERHRYTWRYAFANDEALDVFLEREANESYPGPRQTFGDDVEINSRVLREDHAYPTPGETPTACLNCGATLRGQYCGSCGQRARSRLISLWELISDAFGDLFELDSRLWRTVTPLLIRPGLLTADYLAGRRARYMPPFRMYLVLSLVFFVVAFFNPREELALLYAPDGGVTEASDTGEPGFVDGLSDGIQGEGGEDPPIPEDARDELARIGLDLDELNEQVAAAEDSAENDEAEDEGGLTVSVNGGDPEEGCDLGDYDVSNMPAWFQVRFSRERVEAACTRAFISEDGRQEFLRKMLDNVPLALFILLPLMALVQAFLYPLSRRYYVEHLLFFVHYHAFFFLILTLQVLWDRSVDAVGGPTWLAVLPIVATSFYIPVYLFKAMRRVYEQGWFLTLLKYLMLVIAYVFGFSFMMLFAFLFALASS